MTDNKYTNGKIYKITDNAYSECYIGSTVQTLSNRMGGHRSGYKRFLEHKTVSYTCVYDIFTEYGLENCKIELIELTPCNSQMELRQREGYYIKNMDCINKVVAGRTRQEYKADNKDNLSERRTYYYEQRQDKIKEYNLINKSKFKEYRTQYALLNVEKIQEYYQQHKDAMCDYAKKVVVCVSCNCKMRRDAKSKHVKTLKHLTNLKHIDVITETPETSKQD
jgi:hypothetical protein